MKLQLFGPTERYRGRGPHTVAQRRGGAVLPLVPLKGGNLALCLLGFHHHSPIRKAFLLVAYITIPKLVVLTHYIYMYIVKNFNGNS